MVEAELDIEQIPLGPADGFPNNQRCPVLVYRGAFLRPVNPREVERTFTQNHWTHGWRAGVYRVHHYHSTAHEVLGCYAGEAELQVGGPNGARLKLSAGDVIVIPAGVSHRNLASTSDFSVVGAYAGGRSYDMNYGEADELGEAERNMKSLPLPSADPVAGPAGPLLRHWQG